jgi:hypothetical protein
MTREHFLRHVRRDDIEIAGDAEARRLLGIDRAGDRSADVVSG